MPKLLENDIYNALELDMIQCLRWWKVKSSFTGGDVFKEATSNDRFDRMPQTQTDGPICGSWLEKSSSYWRKFINLCVNCQHVLLLLVYTCAFLTLYNQEMRMFISQHYLIDIGERSREIMFFLLTLISTFPERSEQILRIFEFAVP